MTDRGDQTRAEVAPTRAAVGVGLRLKRIVFRVVFVALLLVLPVCVAELVYRHQWIDTYRSELSAYNPLEVLQVAPVVPTLLALGDSFTAGRGTYPDRLRELLPGWRVVNSGVSGTGIVQANLLAPARLKRFAPAVCVYQLFVGNDLFDVRYPTREPTLSPLRRLYWSLANHLRVISFINYRLGQWRDGVSPGAATVPMGPHLHKAFVPERYDARERRYLAISPAMLDHHVLVTPARAADYAHLLEELGHLRDACRAAKCPLILLIIPHAVQVAPLYRERMEKLGATFSDPGRLSDSAYPFSAGIRRAFAGAPDLLIVDPLVDLQAAESAGVPMYYTHDGHLNPDGQARVAELVANAVRRAAPELIQGTEATE